MKCNYCDCDDGEERGLLFHNCHPVKKELDLFGVKNADIYKITDDEVMYCVIMCFKCINDIDMCDLVLEYSNKFWLPGTEGAWLQKIETDKLYLYKIL